MMTESTAFQTKPVFTVDEAARLLRISRGAAYEAVRRGEIPSVRIGRTIRVPSHGLLRILNEPRIGPEPTGPRLNQSRLDIASEHTSASTPGSPRRLATVASTVREDGQPGPRKRQRAKHVRRRRVAATTEVAAGHCTRIAFTPGPR